MSRSRYPNANCPACRRPIGPDDVVAGCALCQLSWHDACWVQQRGCGTEGCANATPRSTAQSARETIAGAGAKPPRAKKRASASVAPPVEAPVFVPRKYKPSARPWVLAVMAVLATAVALTVAVGFAATQRRAARAELQRLIQNARDEGPRRVVESLEGFLAEGPQGRVAGLARAALDEARRDVDADDYRLVRELDRGANADLDRLEEALRAYLAEHPDGQFNRDAESRLRTLGQDRDDQAFRRASEQAQAAGDDLPRQQAAWEKYLRDYPNGRGAAQARSHVAELPQREDEIRLESVRRDVEKLVAADQLTDALLTIDREMGRLRTASRRQTLTEIAARIESTLERLDAERCERTFGANPADQARALADCRLYLLCYPDGAHREKIAAQVRAIEDAQRKDYARRLGQRVNAVSDDADEALRILASAVRGESIPLADVRDEIVRFHGLRLRRFLEGSMSNLMTVLLLNDTELVGTVMVEDANAVQLDLRPLAEDGARRVRLLPRRQIASITTAPPLEEWGRIRERYAMSTARDFAAPVLLAEIQTLSDMLTGEVYRPEWLACQVFLAALDPQDAEARSAAKELGFVDFDGTLLPAESADSGAGNQERRALLTQLANLFQPDVLTTAQQFVQRLPNSFELTIHNSIPLDMRIGWTLGAVGVEAELAEGGRDGGWIRFRFPLSLSRDESLPLPDSVAGRVDADIYNINERIRLEIEHEVRAIRSRIRGIGVKLKKQGDAIVIGSVAPLSPASQAGLIAGDRLCRVAEEWIAPDAPANRIAARFASSAERVSLTVSRQNRRFVVDVNPSDVEEVMYQSRDRINAQVNLPDKRVNGRDWSEWKNIDDFP